jgi:hypothetical protein
VLITLISDRTIFESNDDGEVRVSLAGVGGNVDAPLRERMTISIKEPSANRQALADVSQTSALGMDVCAYSRGPLPRPAYEAARALIMGGQCANLAEAAPPLHSQKIPTAPFAQITKPATITPAMKVACNKR